MTSARLSVNLKFVSVITLIIQTGTAVYHNGSKIIANLLCNQLGVAEWEIV